MPGDSEIESVPSDSLARKDIKWAHGPVGGMLREGLGRFVISPVMGIYTRQRITGRENLEGLEGPIVFVANHASHMDTPAILRALPNPWRRKTVVAAAADYFYRSKLKATAVSVAFNTVPIERRPGADGSSKLDHIDRMLERGHSLLLFPEGTRRSSESGGRVRRGAAAIAAKHGAYIVPIYIEGSGRAFPPGRLWFRRRGGIVPIRRHPISIHIGKPIAPTLPEEESAGITARIAAFFESRRSGERRRGLRGRRREAQPESPDADDVSQEPQGGQ